MSASESENLTTNQELPVCPEEEKPNDENGDNIVFEENENKTKPPTTTAPTCIDTRNTINVGLKQGYERDARVDLGGRKPLVQTRQ
ncbi:hypothetical protein RN001_012684 [Aquatica leii]|uniref:Uncharacterized protein n=1 Tax=Aquatica leii TaxID=1421715 RepID=A0AAN7PUP2_9COLE|nr:hypothetical protein RN001_012684 [Aquatica leii]